MLDMDYTYLQNHSKVSLGFTQLIVNLGGFTVVHAELRLASYGGGGWLGDDRQRM